MFYLKKLQTYIPSWGATIKQQEEEIDTDYCIVQCAAHTSVHATLSLINTEPVQWNSPDLFNEFTIVHDNLYNTCHQFDQSRITEQFSSTHFKIGTELKTYIRFISNRYLDDTLFTLIGLVMIGFEVLKTPTQVKTELLHVTRIGRDLSLAMRVALERKHCMLLHHPERFLNVFVDCNDWYEVLKYTMDELSRHDQNYKSSYFQVVSMATSCLLLN